MNPTWPTWLKIVYVVACTVSFAAVMYGVGIYVAGPFSEWIGRQIQDWPPAAIFAAIVGSIATLYSLGFWIQRRDQKREATDRLTR